MSDVFELGPEDDQAAVLERLIEGVLSGQIKSLTLRAKLQDGTTQDIQWGYESQEDMDAALARLMKALGDLH